MNGEPLLRVSDLTVTLSGRTIVDGVGFDLAAGEALALVGESGSGKSMTLRSLVRRLPDGAAATGDVRFDGRRLLALSGSELRRLRAREVGMVFQDPRAHINPVRTVGDFLTEGLVLTQGVARGDARARAASALRDVGIADPERRMGQHPHELSGGLLQRVMIASVVLAGPRLILADEPTTALDVSTQEEVVAILDELRRERGIALIFVSHDLDLAAAITDRTAVMQAGTIVETGPSAALHRTARHPYSVALFAARPAPVVSDVH